MSNKSGLRVGLIDGVLLRRRALKLALNVEQFTVQEFDCVAKCVESTDLDAEVLVLQPCINDMMAIMRGVTELRQKYSVPVVVVANLDQRRETKAINDMLHGGVAGYIPSETTDLTTAIAAIRFVRDGGSYAPLNKLLKQKATDKKDVVTPPLTPRQLDVLGLLRKGKPNKIIAYELRMTESTVKVHIRQIMRRLGAHNRTEAVYKSSILGDLAA